MIKLYLSPSVQEKNIGYGKYGSEEEQMNILADKVQNLLLRYDDKIKIYRNNPNWKLSEVVADSNYYDIDLHLALHSNANGRKARGCEVFCHQFDTTAHEYAKVFYKNLETITPTEDRGVKEGYNFYGTNKHMFELYRTLATAVLIEVAFHDNVDDSKWILQNIDLIAENIVDSILQIFEIDKRIDNFVEFCDIENHWAKNDIVEARNLGFIVGYDDNTFRPEKNATRAEMVSILMGMYRKLKGEN